MTTTDLVADFTRRQLIHQVTSPALAEAMRAGRVTGYVGFDPTAASLHVGSLLPVMSLVRLQRAGHRPIALVGGGTGMIGDPSGKQAERTLLDRDTLARNVAGLRGQLERFLDFSGSDGAMLVDNLEWLGSLDLIGFLRDVGKHFSVNAMIARDTVKDRLAREQGLSYTEFSYLLLQAYDFLALYRRHGCVLQMGGSDQWGNIVSGVDLIRRLEDGASFGLTWPLLTRADGQKFGKSEGGNVWLDPALTSPYEFYQFWLNTPDDDVERYLLQFTLLDVEAIGDVMATFRAAPQGRHAQRVLAEEVTRFAHGGEGLARAQKATTVLFQGGDWNELSPQELAAAFRSAPSTTLPRAKLGTADAKLVVLLADDAKLYDSRGRARQDVERGGVAVNNVVVKDPNRVIAVEDLLPGEFVVLRRGKKHYHVLRVG